MRDAATINCQHLEPIWSSGAGPDELIGHQCNLGKRAPAECYCHFQLPRDPTVKDSVTAHQEAA